MYVNLSLKNYGPIYTQFNVVHKVLALFSDFFQNMDKVRQNAHDACNRLGKYRMPFAWTAIWLQNIIKSKDTMGNDSGGSDAESTASNSLDRKTSTASMEQYRNSAAPGAVRRGGPIAAGDSGSLTRSAGKRASWAAASNVGCVVR